MNNQLSKY